jgi:hypothetical protein
MRFLSRWRPYQLFLAWMAYWILLFAVTLGSAVVAVLHAVSGHNNEVNVSFSNTLFSLTVREAGRATWTGSVHLLTAALWIALPPLALWLLWIRSRSGTPRAEEARALRT